MAAQRHFLRKALVWIGLATTASAALAQLTANPSNLNFGVVAPSSIATNTVTLSNYGVSAVSVTSVAVTSPAGNNAFTATSTCPASLPSLGSCTVQVTMATATVGSQTATLTILSTDAINPEMDLPLSGAVSPFTGLAVTAMTTGSATGSATIQWTTGTAGTSQILYGIGNLNNATPVLPNLTTSHSITLNGLQGGVVWWYAAVSQIGGVNQQSNTQQFEMCDNQAQVPLQGTVNNYYEYGSYSINWQNLSGASVSPTLCGQPVNPVNGTLDGGSSFSIQVANSLEIVPSPSNWQISVNGNQGIGLYTTNFASGVQNTNITALLKAAAGGNLTQLYYDPVTGQMAPGNVNINTTGTITAGNIVANTGTFSALPGYKQNQGTVNSTAKAHNRDQQTAVTVTPQDWCPTAGNGDTDDTACVDDASIWLASLNTSAPKRLLLPWTPTGYIFTNAGARYLCTLPYDWGDYNGSAGFVTAASAQVYFNNAGNLIGCSITGGTGYTANGYLPIQILDPSHRGSGAAAYVQTNVSGVPTDGTNTGSNVNCTIQLAGMRYPQSGVLALVLPEGGDGAVATATLTTNTFPTSQNPITPTNGGLGYSAVTNNRPLVSPPVGTGLLQCATYPTWQATVTGSSVTSISVLNAGSGCTWNGSASFATVPLYFGASCGGAQCGILPPEQPTNIPISVAVRSGVQIVGVGNPTINTECSLLSTGCSKPVTTTGTTVFPDTVAFGDPWGDQGGGVRGDLVGTTLNQRSAAPNISNLTINAMYGFWFPLLGGGTFTGLTLNTTVGFFIGNIQQTLSGSGVAFSPVLFENNTFNVAAGVVVAAGWHSRSTYASAGGTLGGTFMLHSLSTQNEILNGSTGGIIMRNTSFTSPGTDATVDTWFDKFVWKGPNAPATPYTDATHKLSNGFTSCVLSPTLSFTSRNTDTSFGNNGGFTFYEWFNCFRGVRGMLVEAQPRYSNQFANPAANTSTDSYFLTMQNVNSYNRWRQLYLGNAQTVDIHDVLDVNTTATADPFLAGTGQSNTAIWLMRNVGTPISGTVQDIYSTANQAIQAYYFGLPAPWNGYAGTTTTQQTTRLLLRNVTSITDTWGGLNPGGGAASSTTFNAITGFRFNGTSGFTGTKTAGTCVLTIQGGIITNVTGC